MSVIGKTNIRSYPPELPIERPEALRGDGTAPEHLTTDFVDYTALDSEKPGVSGMKPLMLVAAMTAGLAMWAGLFFLGHTFLHWVF